MNTLVIRILSFLIVQIPFFTQIVSGQEYAYDHNGNLIADQYKGIQSIEYNILNLPETISFQDGKKIVYSYSALGIKLSKEIYNSSGNLEQKQEYLNTIEYSNNTLQFITSSQGYIEPEDNNMFTYIYEYKDHLQNTRVSFADNDKDGHIDLVENSIDKDGDGDLAVEIREVKSYYPFGLKHYGFGIVRGRQHQYAFGGKELENAFDLNWYDYGARRYDPVVGRWLSLDPLTENGHYWSPYNYAFNNPVLFIDPNGLWPSFSDVLDYGQEGLDYAGAFPGLGIVPDVINAGVSVVRGDLEAAAGRGLQAIPGLGQVVLGSKKVKKAVDIVDRVDDALTLASDVMAEEEEGNTFTIDVGVKLDVDLDTQEVTLVTGQGDDKMKGQGLFGDAGMAIKRLFTRRKKKIKDERSLKEKASNLKRRIKAITVGDPKEADRIIIRGKSFKNRRPFKPQLPEARPRKIPKQLTAPKDPKPKKE